MPSHAHGQAGGQTTSPSLRARLRAWYKSVWTNRHGPKLTLLGPRYPNTLEFQQSPEGQRVWREHDLIQDRWVEGIGKVTGG